MTKELILTVGLPGSGKSTYVDNNFIKVKSGYQILCLDDIRLSMGDTFNRKTESIIRAIYDIMARAFMERSLSIIIDSTNVCEATVMEWRNLVDEYKYYMKGLFFDTPIEECMRRKLGKNKLTRSVYTRMELQLNDLKPEMENYFDSFEIIKFSW